MIIPTFTCPFCNEVREGFVSMEGPMPTGFLPACDCKGFREDWERRHREEMERRKVARRKFTSINQIGREVRKKKK